jgi:hypothetical protein
MIFERRTATLLATIRERIALALALVFAVAWSSVVVGQEEPRPEQDPSLVPIETPGTAVEWQFGLGGTVFSPARSDGRMAASSGGANHTAFRITNDRETVLSGILEIEIMTQHRKVKVLREKVEIGPGSTKRLSFALTDEVLLFQHDAPRFAAGRLLVENPDGPPTVLWQFGDEFQFHYERSVSWVSYQGVEALPVLVVGDASIDPAVTFNNGSIQQLRPRLGDRPLQIIRADPWAMPDWYPCLATVRGVVLSDNLDGNQFTRAQERAIAGYVASGGVLIVGPAVEGWPDRLFRHGPLPLVPVPGEASRWYCGTGVVEKVKLSGLVANLPDDAEQQQIQKRIDAHPEYPMMNRLSRRSYSGELGVNGWKTVTVLAGFLTLYALISGPALLMFRRLRHKVVIRIVLCVIAAFSGLSVMLGLFVRAASGDYEWVTLTEIGTGGGAIQHGQYHLISAGSRKQLFKLSDPDALLVPAMTPMHGYYDFDEATGERLVLTGREARGEMSVPIAPWGHAFLKSRSYLADVQPIDISVTVKSDAPNGKMLDVAVTNLNSFYVSNAMLVFYWGAELPISNPRMNENIGVRQFSIGPLSPGRKRSLEPLHFNRMLPSSAQRRFRTGAWNVNIPSPAPPLVGRFTVYLFGELVSSPGVRVSAESGFEQSGEAHYFMQRLAPGQYPAYEELVGELPAREELATVNGLPVAAWVAGKPGLVQSPYGPPGQYVDVSQKPAGSQTRCPFTGAPFIVPEPPSVDVDQ